MHFYRTPPARFIKFLATGGFGAACYILFSFILTMIGMPAWISSFLVYCCLVPIMYFIQHKFVFESIDPHSTSFPKYLTIQLIGIFLSGVLPFAFDFFDLKPKMSFIAVIAFITATNYILQSRWAFLNVNKPLEIKNETY